MQHEITRNCISVGGAVLRVGVGINMQDIQLNFRFSAQANTAINYTCGDETNNNNNNGDDSGNNDDYYNNYYYCISSKSTKNNNNNNTKN